MKIYKLSFQEFKINRVENDDVDYDRLNQDLEEGFLKLTEYSKVST